MRTQEKGETSERRDDRPTDRPRTTTEREGGCVRGEGEGLGVGSGDPGLVRKGSSQEREVVGRGERVQGRTDK